MTSILKGLAALIAVVTVNVGGAHMGIVNKPIHLPHAATRATATTDATTDPIGSDAFQMRGRTQVTVVPPTPAPAETPAENQPLAQLPIAAPPPAPRPAPPIFPRARLSTA